MCRNLLIGLIYSMLACAVASALPITSADNPHNMSSTSSAGSVRALPPSSGGTDQICIFCHTPHSAAPQSPLWGRPDPVTMGSFPVYAQPLGIKNDTALTGYSASNPDYPSGASRMCLSCHDGATSVGVLLGGQTIVMEGGLTTLPTSINLATSHPVSFNYNNNVISTVLNPAEYQMPDGTVDTPLDGAGQMQCTTCHDPHEDTMAAYGLPFWRHQGTVLVTRYDDVCNACHWNNTVLPEVPVPPSGPAH